MARSTSRADTPGLWGKAVGLDRLESCREMIGSWRHLLLGLSGVKRLCAGAGSSVEPARCYDLLMSGQVAWGGSSVWQADRALALCAGTLSAAQTITCVRDAIALGEGWRSATQNCRRLGASADAMLQRSAP